MRSKRAVLWLAVLLAAAVSAHGKQEVDFVFGPRVGGIYIFSDWAAFNSRIQGIFPDLQTLLYHL